jgi:hypothetical protein
MARDDDMHSDAHAEPGFRTGANPREEAFTSVGDALARVRDELGLPDGGAFDELVARWSEIVGPDVATHTRLDAVRDGVASVTATDPLWATQLRYLEAEIVAGVAAVIGREVVRSVRVRVAG